MKNIERAFQNHTHIDKIRVAKFPVHTITGGTDDIKSRNGMMNTVLGLLAKGDINCAGVPIDPNGDLFNQQKVATVEVNDPRPARKPGEVPAGVVLTEAEKQKAEEEARLKREEEERIQREKEEAEAEEAARVKRENSWWNRTKRGLTNFGKTIIGPEDE
jgi:cell division protein FtsA